MSRPDAMGGGSIRAVIFDLDGVIVSTDELHYRAWQAIADEVGVPFDRAANEHLRGVSRMQSLGLVLGSRTASLSTASILALAERKNDLYLAMLEDLSPADVLPGVREWLAFLRRRGIKVAIGSSSRNASVILGRIGLADAFDVVADGTRIRQSKPDPEVFLLAATDLGVAPHECLVVEDATAGVEAALAGGMRVLAVGAASRDPRANFAGTSLAAVSPDDVLS